MTLPAGPPVSFVVGNLRIDVVSDGYFLQDAGAVFGIVPRTMWEPLTGSPDEKNRMRMALNCLLVRDGPHVVLVDTGVGAKIEARLRERAYPGDYGHLLASLAAAGVRPADVTAVVNTHLHFDHCGWNTAAVHGGATIPTFPNARYYIARGEWDAATHPNERTRASYLADNLLPVAEAGLLELSDGETQVTPAIRLLPTPGHTDDHAAVVFSSGGETAIYLGDIVQHPAQLERTAWVSAFDLLPLVSMETKKRVVDDALRSGSLLLLPHAPYPGAGRISEHDGRNRYEAVGSRQ
jgi:glyoxylase-like metal-dependent hydrolase (beta-lactamase superfamily II)